MTGSATASRARAVGEKTPENVFFFPRLLHLFPQAKFIGIARDPRDVLASAWHLFHRPTPGEDVEAAKTAFVERALPPLNHCARAMLALAEQHPAQVALTTYEALLQDPAPVLAALFRFLDVTDAAATVADCVSANSLARVTRNQPTGNGTFFRMGPGPELGCDPGAGPQRAGSAGAGLDISTLRLDAVTKSLAKVLALAMALTLPALAKSPRGPGAPPAFVACPANGMSGPEDPPASARMPALPGAAARKLALYAAAGMSVVAPRGWHCIELYGSSGAFLLVTPGQHTAAELQDFRTLTGPVVEMTYLNGYTSGRFDVARVLARLFPARRALVRSVIEEGLEPASRFPRGPYPSDRTTRRNRREVDFVTPAGATGMGLFEDRLGRSRDPVVGFARLGPHEGGVMLLDVRLPPTLRPLTAAIMQAARDLHGGR